MTLIEGNNSVSRWVERRSSGQPIPLTATSYAIDIRSGLAKVELVRTFRNVEGRPIEATITFPVPFDAVVWRLEAKIGDRILTGKARAKAAARDDYEAAIDDGKPAVLHEELLRGLHMLSVANVAPGTEITVSATFSMPVVLADGNGRFRIPVTVGQIYGDLPLPESDALVTGGPVLEADLSVAADRGVVRVNGHSPVDGRLTVKLDRPIEIEVAGLYDGMPTELTGQAADGRRVALSFQTLARGEADLDIDLLLDVSGSMAGRVTSRAPEKRSQWDAAREGFAAGAERWLGARDRVTFWTFSTDCRCHGTTSGTEAAQFVDRLPFDGGGTELAGAVARVSASRRDTNVLLVTDGQAGREIDIQAAVASGARFTVVLIGEAAFEVNVGYLAALTGGQLLVCHEGEVVAAVTAALAAMRRVSSPAMTVTERPETVCREIAGTRIVARWLAAADGTTEREGFAAAVGAFAAQLAIPGMETQAASRLAEAEGIVGHLTSLVLVDEAAERTQGLPATRKVPLASPAAEVRFLACAPRTMDFCASVDLSESVQPKIRSAQSRLMKRLRSSDFRQSVGRSDADLAMRSARRAKLAEPPSLDWDEDPEALAAGDVSGQALSIRNRVSRIAALPEIVALANSLGLTAMSVAVALLAEQASPQSRTAARIARRAFEHADPLLMIAARTAVSLARNSDAAAGPCATP